MTAPTGLSAMPAIHRSARRGSADQGGVFSSVVCTLLEHEWALLRWWKRLNGNRRYRFVCVRCGEVETRRHLPKGFPLPLPTVTG